MFCGADEDTGKTKADTCNPTVFRTHFRGTTDRRHRNKILLNQKEIVSVV